MNWVLIIFVVNFCAHNVIETHAEDVTLAATDQIDDTGSDDVRCTGIDDVIAIRRSLCPAQCRCSPIYGKEVWTKLIVNCSGMDYHRSSSARLSQQLNQLLSRCVSELTDLTITYTPVYNIPEVLCNLSELRSLELSFNRLMWLRSNCFTRMPNLTSFRADYNFLGILQVRYDVG